ncbi:MAG: hypothetical protein WD688_05685 [Candidatus Binatia bacterium]
MKLIDLAAVIFTFFAAFAVASGSFTLLSFAEILAIRIKLSNLLFFATYVAVLAAIFAACGLYVSHRLSRWTRQLREILLAVSLITAVLLVFRWPFDFTFASNRFLLIFWLLSVAALMLPRVLGYQLLYLVRSRGRNLRRIVIIGEGSDATVLGERLENERIFGYKVVRIIDAKETSK